MFGRVLRFGLVAAVAATLAVPGVALAAAHKKSPTKKDSVVMFVLRGTVDSYSAASGATNGSIGITLFSGRRGENRDHTDLANASVAAGATGLVFMTTSRTRVVLHRDSAITVGDRVVVKIRAPRDSTTTSTTPPALSSDDVVQIVDQGAAHK